MHQERCKYTCRHKYKKFDKLTKWERIKVKDTVADKVYGKVVFMEQIMSIEISNYTTFGQPLESGKETKTGEAQIRANKAHQETGTSIECLTTTENASRCDLTSTARLLQQLAEAISTEPAVDPKRVEATVAKINSGRLGILKSNTEEKLNSAEKIANQLLDMDAQLPDLRFSTPEA